MYIGGAIIYMLRIPERIFPNKFDIFVSNIHLIYNKGFISSDLSFIHRCGGTDALLCGLVKFLQ